MSSILPVGGTCTGSVPQTTKGPGLARQVVGALESIGSALQSGDLAGAQQTFGNLAQLIGSVNPDRPIGQELNALGRALQSGDSSGAQQALASVAKDLLAAIQAQEAKRAANSESGGTSQMGALAATLESIQTTFASSSTSSSDAASGSSSDSQSSMSGLNLIA
jgi:hypothetical protein